MTDALETLKKSIIKLTEEKKYSTLRDILSTMNAADIAALFEEDIPESVLPLLFRLLPKELAADTFVEMSPDTQELLIKGFSDSELKEVVDELYVDDAVDIVEEMPANVVKRILTQADPEKRRMINDILKYPEDSAGSIMTTEFVELRPHMTVQDAILHIRRCGITKETINTCYICEKDRRLIGMVTIQDLILGEDNVTMEELMDGVISVGTMEDQESVAQLFGKYDFLAMPVVDGEGRLVGIVTVDDVLDVLEEETTEDIEKMSAIVPADKPYLKQTTFELWKSRIPWLLLLMLSSTFTSMILMHFENELAQYMILTAYIPMLMGTGGNSGGQSSVTVIRGISLNEVEFSDIFRVLWKEIRVAVLCGITLAVCNFVKLLLFDRLEVLEAATICVSLVVTVLFAKVVGCTLPLFAKKMGFDPAVMASPFITTIVDAVSLLIYFQFAKSILGI